MIALEAAASLRESLEFCAASSGHEVVPFPGEVLLD